MRVGTANRSRCYLLLPGDPDNTVRGEEGLESEWNEDDVKDT